MPEMHNIDANLIADMQNQSQNIPPVTATAVNDTASAVDNSMPAADPQAPEAAALPSAPPPQDLGEQSEQAPITKENTEHTKNTPQIDEYGNPIEPPKMYTEEEVQRIMNERFAQSRLALKQQQISQQQPSNQQNAQPSDGSEDEWQKQLKDFIFKANDEYIKEQQQRQWQAQEAQRQAEFEARFSSGMNKYSDFREVVAGKNITDGIMLAARALDNPAAFVYGAAKLHPQELERISRIPDPYAQALEAGRLHERMVKERRIASQAPKPIETIKSDVPAKNINPQPSLDQRILDYGKKKLGRG